VKAGETLHLTVTLLPIESPTTISMTVSDENPRSGDTVTYTIRATGTTGQWADVSTMAYEAPVHFEIIDELPIEVSNISVSCGGGYMPSIPGTCYDLDGNSLTVFGGYWINSAFDITVTATGTVVGEPGTVVTNTAYLLTDRWRGEPQMAIARYIPADSPSATAVLTIAQDPVDPTPSPTPDPTETPDPGTPVPTPDPTETPDPGTPVPTETPAPGETPAPDQTPAPGETPAAAGTPAAVTALPNTGAGGNATTPMIAILTLAAASLLAMGGMVIRGGAARGRS